MSNQLNNQEFLERHAIGSLHGYETSELSADSLGLSYEVAHVARYMKAGSLQNKQLHELCDNMSEAGHIIRAIEPFNKRFGDGSEALAGYVLRTDHEVIVAYRGTKTLFEVGRDLKIGYTTMKFGDKPENQHYVHAGFKEDYESSKEGYEAALKEVSKGHSNLPIIFTGHSLGGAVAQLAAADYAAKNSIQKDAVKGVHTFGAPNVFAAGKAVNWYNNLLGSKTLHVIAAADPMPYLLGPFLGYARTGFTAVIPSGFYVLAHKLKESYGKIVNTIFKSDAWLTSEVWIKKAEETSITIWSDIRDSLSHITKGARNSIQTFWNAVIKSAKPSHIVEANEIKSPQGEPSLAENPLNTRSFSSRS